MAQLDGKRAIVTGASSGIGAATTRMLEEAGARVYTGSRSQGNLDVTDSESTARFFADNARLQASEFSEGGYRLGATGSPILNEATGYLEARVHSTHPGGDHTVILGEVVALEILSEDEPLIYYRSGYRKLG